MLSPDDLEWPDTSTTATAATPVAAEPDGTLEPSLPPVVSVEQPAVEFASTELSAHARPEGLEQQQQSDPSPLTKTETVHHRLEWTTQSSIETLVAADSHSVDATSDEPSILPFDEANDSYHPGLDTENIPPEPFDLPPTMIKTTEHIESQSSPSTLLPPTQTPPPCSPLAEIKTEHLANSIIQSAPPLQPATNATSIDSILPPYPHAQIKDEPHTPTREFKIQHPIFIAPNAKTESPPSSLLASPVSYSPRKRLIFAPSPSEHASIESPPQHDKNTPDSPATLFADIDSDVTPPAIPRRQFELRIIKEEHTTPCPLKKNRNRKGSMLPLIMRPATLARVIKSDPVRPVPPAPLARRFNTFARLGNASTWTHRQMYCLNVVYEKDEEWTVQDLFDTVSAWSDDISRRTYSLVT